MSYSKHSMSSAVRRLLRFTRPVLAEKESAAEAGVLMGDILSDVRVNVIRIIGYAFVGAVLSMMYMAVVPHKYSLTAELIPIPEWLSIQPQQSLNGLSTLLTGNNIDLSALFEASLESKGIYEDLDRKLSARQYVFSDMWDAKTSSWHLPPGILGVAKLALNQFREVVGYPRWAGPTIDDLRDTLVDRIYITRNSDGSILIEMKSRHPNKDRQILDFVLSKSDEIVRSQMRTYVSRTISGLEYQISRQSEASLRSALIDKLADQMTLNALLENNRIMTLNLSPVEVSDTPIYPSFKGTLVVGFLVGMFIPLFWIWYLRVIR